MEFSVKLILLLFATGGFNAKFIRVSALVFADSFLLYKGHIKDEVQWHNKGFESWKAYNVNGVSKFISMTN